MPTPAELKYLCDECGAHCKAEDALNGVHPFIVGDAVLGCPKCREMSLLKACEVAGCYAQATCVGDADGFKHVCGTHFSSFALMRGSQ